LGIKSNYALDRPAGFAEQAEGEQDLGAGKKGSRGPLFVRGSYDRITTNEVVS